MILSPFIFKFISVKKICYIKKLNLCEVKHSYAYVYSCAHYNAQFSLKAES